MSGKDFFAKLLGFLQYVGRQRFSRKPHTHNYTSSRLGKDYAFDEINECSHAYMTAYGRNIKRGDYIFVSLAGVRKRYKVETIDYYADPPDLWIALLVKCETEIDCAKL